MSTECSSPSPAIDLSIPPPSPHGYTIYSKSGCPYCDRAKHLLAYEDTQIIDCDSLLSDRDFFLETMRNYCGRDYQMFPMIFHNGRFIGGYDDTKAYFDSQLLSCEDF
jgi:glutaredoxin